ncbi:hypothetical protein BC828DRAFT_390229 [Blastocladiella britannica]|nr:hypothetical protein BC828DRAFT_390229 [Blastocladiella britannica]
MLTQTDRMDSPTADADLVVRGRNTRGGAPLSVSTDPGSLASLASLASPITENMNGNDLNAFEWEADLPRLMAFQAETESFLHHLDVMKQANGLALRALAEDACKSKPGVPRSSRGTGSTAPAMRLPRADQNAILEALVRRGRDEGGACGLDQLIEEMLAECRLSGSPADDVLIGQPHHAPSQPPIPALVLAPMAAPMATPSSPAVLVASPTCMDSPQFPDTSTSWPASVPGKAAETQAKETPTSSKAARMFGETERAMAAVAAFKRRIKKLKSDGLGATAEKSPADPVVRPHGAADWPMADSVAPTRTTITKRKAWDASRDVIAQRPQPIFAARERPNLTIDTGRRDVGARAEQQPRSLTLTALVQSPRSATAGSSDRDDGAETPTPRFVAKPVPASTLVPKYHEIMRKGEQRRKERQAELALKLQTSLLPFKFEYSNSLKARREQQQSTPPELSRSPTTRTGSLSTSPRSLAPRRQRANSNVVPRAAGAAMVGRVVPRQHRTRPPIPRSDSPTAEHTFQPAINPTVPDFSAAHEKFAEQLARRRQSERGGSSSRSPASDQKGFAGIERHQQQMDERKRNTIARVLEMEKAAPVRAKPPPPFSPLLMAADGSTEDASDPPPPRSTRAADLKRIAREAVERARVEAEAVEKEQQAARERRAAALRQVIRAAMVQEEQRQSFKSRVRMRDVVEEAGSSRKAMASSTKQYQSFLQEMEARLDARGLSFQGSSEVRRQAEAAVERRVSAVLQQSSGSSQLIPENSERWRDL